MVFQIGDPGSAVYLDLPQYRDFWKKVEELDVRFISIPEIPFHPTRAYMMDILGFWAPPGHLVRRQQFMPFV